MSHFYGDQVNLEGAVWDSGLSGLGMEDAPRLGACRQVSGGRWGLEWEAGAPGW